MPRSARQRWPRVLLVGYKVIGYSDKPVILIQDENIKSKTRKSQSNYHYNQYIGYSNKSAIRIQNHNSKHLFVQKNIGYNDSNTRVKDIGVPIWSHTSVFLVPPQLVNSGLLLPG